VSGLLLAARYLTIVPLADPGTTPREALGRAAGWFPVVGAVLGLGLGATDWLTTRLFPSLLAALLTVTVWKFFTGGLHLDGLADCLDGLMGHDRERRLAIMRDSRIGTFGAVGLILVLLLEIVAVADLPQLVRWRVLVLAPAVARATPALLARLFRPARADGQGAAFVAGVGWPQATLAFLVAALVAVVVLGLPGLLAAVLALLAAVAVAGLIARRLGGITGDVFGAAVESAELVAALAMVAWLGARA